MGLEHLTTLDAIKQLLDGTQIKVLAFEEGDYGLWSKRLEQGRFATLNCADDNKRTLITHGVSGLDRRGGYDAKKAQKTL